MGTVSLDSMKTHGFGTIRNIETGDHLRKRLYGYGLMEGNPVTVLYNKGSAMIIQVENCKIALENKLASMIRVETV